MAIPEPPWPVTPSGIHASSAAVDQLATQRFGSLVFKERSESKIQCIHLLREFITMASNTQELMKYLQFFVYIFAKALDSSQRLFEKRKHFNPGVRKLEGDPPHHRLLYITLNAASG